MDDENEYRLSIRERPWRATLERLKPPPERRPSDADSEEFSDPLDLLERLENHDPRTGGLK